MHHWSRSAGSGEDVAGEPARRAAVGRARFHARHGNEDTARALQETQELLARSAVELPFELKELGVQSEAPLLDLPREREVLIEISACPFFPLAAGEALTEALDAHLVVIHGAAHAPNFEQKRAFNQTVQAWLEASSPQPGRTEHHP